MPKAYLIVHKLAIYNDVWYDDWTLQSEAANPTALLNSRAEAEALVRHLTRETMRGAMWSDLESDEATLRAIERLPNESGTLDPALAKTLHEGYIQGWHIPATLTDGELDSLIELLGIQLYFILETEAQEFDIRLAQSLLELTPERPRVYVRRELEYVFDQDFDVDSKEQISVERIDPSDDPAVQRLNRVTALFGRKYAFEPNY